MDAFRFPRHVRLLSAGDYRHVFDHVACKASNPAFLLLASKREDNNARLGLIVAKKHVRKAVQRNRIKRIIREVFRHHQTELEQVDLIVLVRKGADDLSNEDLFKQLRKLVIRIQQRKNQDPREFVNNRKRQSDRRTGNG